MKCQCFKSQCINILQSYETDLFDLDRTLTGTTMLSQSGPGSNVNEKGLNMLQSRQLPQSDMMKNWTEGSHSLKETRSFV